MLDSIYQMTFKLFLNHIFTLKTPRCCHIHDIAMEVIS